MTTNKERANDSIALERRRRWSAEAKRDIVQKTYQRDFFKHLQSRGLRLIVSDDHAGMKAARMTVFLSVPWQRCQFHLSQNAQRYAPKRSMRPEIAEVMSG